MSIATYIIGDSPVPLWGLSSHTRLTRSLHRAGITQFVETLDDLPPKGMVLLVRGNYVYDARVLKSLSKEHNVLLEITENKKHVAVAAIVSNDLAPHMIKVFCEGRTIDESWNIRTVSLETLTPAYQEELRKYDPPYVLPVETNNQGKLEDHLFAGSYKGVTDLITKWVWPKPAKWATHWCVRFGIRPNHITSLSVILTIAAGWLFMDGFFEWGLLLGWLMTFLDTVDGKLARVTLTSSRIGHILDHGLDIIHPPLWYIAWGLGLSAFHPGIPGLSVTTTLWVIVIGYIAGRVCEGTFQWCLGQFGIFCWRPLDSYNRLVTARRNPNLILLTGSVLVGRPDLGLLAVAGWTVCSSGVLAIRLIMAVGSRIRSGPLHPWFRDIEKMATTESLAVRIFTKKSIHSE